MYCMKCKTILNVDDNFCRSCGTPVSNLAKDSTDEPWQQAALPKNNNGNHKKPTFLKKWWFIVLVCFVFFIFSMFRKDLVNIQIKENLQSNSDPWVAATKEYESIKKQQKLPLQTDKYTIFKDMFIKGHEINYVYSVSNLALSHELKDAFAKDTLSGFKKGSCQDPLIVQHGGKMVITYQFLTGDLVYSYDKSNCLK